MDAGHLFGVSMLPTSLISSEVAAAGSRGALVALTWRQVRRLLLFTAVGAALAFRLTALSTYGFSEDESAKLRAIESYRHGDFSANAEHPMLMKLAMWGSITVASQWNHMVAPGLAIAPETAVRLPNAAAGVATVGAVFGVGQLLFGSSIAVVAALLVAVDPNITALNRIGKEDTFLMLFFLLGVWCYEQAKVIGGHDLRRGKRWYVISGAMFGLMLASKYMPQFFGLYLLYQVIYQRDAGANMPNRRHFYLAMGGVFLIANFAVLSPATWAYCLGYVRGDGLNHHGFLYAQQMYVTDVPVSPRGVPATYYLHLLATKVPVATLVAAFVGLIPLVQRRRERGYIWLRVLLLLPLLGYSVMAAKFQRYALPMLLFIDILAAVGLVTAIRWIWRRAVDPVTRLVACAAVCGIVLGWGVADQLRAAPFYSLHQNWIGARLAPPAQTFPEEAYDYGVREAIRDIEREAAPRALILSDATGVVDHYVAAGARRDLESQALSQRGLAADREQWVLVQNDHIYFENQSSVVQLRQGGRPWREYAIRGVPVLQVFRLAPVSHRHGE